MSSRLAALALVAVAAAALAGCAGDDACGGYGGKSCIALLVESPPERFLSVDQVGVTASGGFTLAMMKSPAMPGRATSLPVTLAVLPPTAFQGDFALSVVGLVSGIPVGESDVAGSVPSAGAHLRLAVVLGAPSSDGGADGPPVSPDAGPCGTFKCGTTARCVQLGCRLCAINGVCAN